MGMTRAKIQASQEAARAFLEASETLLVELDRNALEPRYYDPPELVRSLSPHDQSWGSAASGTLRRRSMDLTRSLAVLRKP